MGRNKVRTAKYELAIDDPSGFAQCPSLQKIYMAVYCAFITNISVMSTWSGTKYIFFPYLVVCYVYVGNNDCGALLYYELNVNWNVWLWIGLISHFRWSSAKKMSILSTRIARNHLPYKFFFWEFRHSISLALQQRNVFAILTSLNQLSQDFCILLTCHVHWLLFHLSFQRY